MNNFSNLRQLLEARRKQLPEKIFLFSETDRRSWTYEEFDRDVNRTANLLAAKHIKKGDVVSLLLPNSAEYVIAYFACFKIGAIAGPVNSLLKSEEIEFVTQNSESRLVLSGSRFEETLAAIDIPETVVFDSVKQAAGDHPDTLPETEIGPDDDAIIIYTSGTTGKPKGCLLSHNNLIANARQIADWMQFDEDDRLLTIMPLFHMNAVSVTTMTALYAGASTVVSPKFSASRFWDIIDEYGITSFGSVATMLSMLLAGSQQSAVSSEQIDESPFAVHLSPTTSLRFAMCGSAPVPAEVLRKFEETFGCLVIEGYGLSESTCRSTFNPPDKTRRPGSCGKPIGNEMRVVDDSGNLVPNGELGEIVLRGENIFKGYFKNDDATETAFEGGWFHTGDIGYRDADGFFYIADRKSDMIIRGGENIYPREIDDLLFSHPSVASAAAIGVPDELYGEEVAAFVVMKNGIQVTESEIIEYCRSHLADFKCPKKVLFIDEIPKGPTGKLLKRELAKMYGKMRSAG
ncbi:MAG: long-chain-fatty-acid--CoA ligase [Acidobacteriota bacterium]